MAARRVSGPCRYGAGRTRTVVGVRSYGFKNSVQVKRLGHPYGRCSMTSHDVWFQGFTAGVIRSRGPRRLRCSHQAVRRWRSAVCPFAGCLCRGRPLQFSRAGASIEPTEDGGYRLIPCTSAEVPSC